MQRDKACLMACASLLWLSPLCLGAAHAAEDRVTVQRLRSDLAERDKAIAAMQRRMDDLERRVVLLARNQAPASPASDQPAQAQRSDGGQAPPGPGTKVGAQTAASGSNVDFQETSRALERSLVLTGGLLLPKGTLEIEPSAQYAYRRTSGLTITPSGPGAFALTGEDIRNQSVAYGPTVRLGLPWRSQFELNVPVVYQHTQSNTGGVVRSRDANGLGDVQATLSKQILLDSGWRPGLIGFVSYKAPTASSKLVDFTNASALGFPGVGVGLTAVKRHDPLVFYGGYSHMFNQADRRNGVKLRPGDSDSVTLGGLLAVSPDVSLRAQFLVEHSREFSQDGARRPGLGSTAGIVSFGASLALSESTVLDVELGAGVTQDSPDFTAAVSLPIRF